MGWVHMKLKKQSLKNLKRLSFFQKGGSGVLFFQANPFVPPAAGCWIGPETS